MAAKDVATEYSWKSPNFTDNPSVKKDSPVVALSLILGVKYQIDPNSLVLRLAWFS